jgi:hypothetical protein
VIVAISIVVRIIAARKKRQDENSTETATMPEPEPEIESGRGHWELSRPAAPVIQQKTRTAPKVKKFALPSADFPSASDESTYDVVRRLSSGRPDESAAYTGAAVKSAAAGGSGTAVSAAPLRPAGRQVSGTGTFLQKIERLSTLKKAIVFSEILARPKGLAAD